VLWVVPNPGGLNAIRDAGEPRGRLRGSCSSGRDDRVTRPQALSQRRTIGAGPRRLSASRLSASGLCVHAFLPDSAGRDIAGDALYANRRLPRLVIWLPSEVPRLRVLLLIRKIYGALTGHGYYPLIAAIWLILHRG
jgi:hypothetical protein